MCSTTLVKSLTCPVDTDEALVLVIEKFGTAKHKASDDATHDAENDLQPTRTADSAGKVNTQHLQHSAAVRPVACAYQQRHIIKTGSVHRMHTHARA